LNPTSKRILTFISKNSET